MKKYLFLFVFISFTGAFLNSAILFPGVLGTSLMDSLIKYYKSSSNLGYDAGRDTLYGIIDKIDGYLTCVYSGWSIYMQAGQDPSTWAYSNDINCEHTWPQSLGATGLGEGDLHHLYPTEVDVNSARGNLPFGDVADNQTNRWYYNNSYITTVPSSNINNYSELLTNIKFEPREDHKGNAARSMFYFYTMYKGQYLALDPDTSFFKDQIATLLLWHYQDIVDARELTRTYKIGSYQQNKPNPYVIDTTLARRVFFPEMYIEENSSPFKETCIDSCPHIKYDIYENVLYYKNAENISLTIKIHDITGRTVYEGSLKSDRLSLCSAGLSRGVYFLIVKSYNSAVFKTKITILQK